MPDYTSWGLILRASAEDSPQARAALEELSGTYWLPVYGYVRRKVTDPEKALDFTQEFFATFLEKGWIQSADRSRGRFRTFLLVVLDRFMADQHDREAALKRGGGRPIVSIDANQAEDFLAAHSAPSLDPAKAFTRHCALAVIQECLEHVRRQLSTNGRELYYELLVRFHGFNGKNAEGNYRKLAVEFRISETDVANYLRRARAAFRQALEDRIIQAVQSPGDVQSEIADLLNSLSE